MIQPEVINSFNDAHFLVEVTLNGVSHDSIAVKHADNNALPDTQDCHICAHLINVRKRDVAVLPFRLLERTRRFDFDKAVGAVGLAHHTVNVGRYVRLAGHGVNVRIRDNLVVRIAFRQPRIHILLGDVAPQLV